MYPCIYIGKFKPEIIFLKACPRPGSNPQPHALQSTALITRPPRLRSFRVANPSQRSYKNGANVCIEMLKSNTKHKIYIPICQLFGIPRKQFQWYYNFWIERYNIHVNIASLKITETIFTNNNIINDKKLYIYIYIYIYMKTVFKV